MQYANRMKTSTLDFALDSLLVSDAGRELGSSDWHVIRPSLALGRKDGALYVEEALRPHFPLREIPA